MTNYSEQFGALQFCLRFGLIPAQKLKAKQLPDKFSLYKIIFPQEYWVLDSIKSIFEQEGLAIIPQSMIFFTQELQDVDEEALTYLQENKSTMLILQINVENVMDFEHFVLDSPK